MCNIWFPYTLYYVWILFVTMYDVARIAIANVVVASHIPIRIHTAKHPEYVIFMDFAC